MAPHDTAAAQNQRLRVLIVDAHEVFRAACTALLRTEGIEVIADVALGCDGVAAARELAPDVALVDAASTDEDVFETVRWLQALPSAPVVVLTASAVRSTLDARVAGFPFLAKADICARAIWNAIAASHRKAFDPIFHSQT
jgi:DNA-binding NarL/FixJ family response regulator